MKINRDVFHPSPNLLSIFSGCTRSGLLYINNENQQRYVSFQFKSSFCFIRLHTVSYLTPGKAPATMKTNRDVCHSSPNLLSTFSGCTQSGLLYINNENQQRYVSFQFKSSSCFIWLHTVSYKTSLKAPAIMKINRDVFYPSPVLLFIFLAVHSLVFCT